MVVLARGLTAEAWETERLWFEYQKYRDGTRHPMFAPREPLREQVSINLEQQIWWEFYFHTRVHGGSTDAQFRTVGWEFEFFVRPIKHIELGIRHHSRHNLDQTTVSPGRFPVEDSLVLRIFFIP